MKKLLLIFAIAITACLANVNTVHASEEPVWEEVLKDVPESISIDKNEFEVWRFDLHGSLTFLAKDEVKEEINQYLPEGYEVEAVYPTYVGYTELVWDTIGYTVINTETKQSQYNNSIKIVYNNTNDYNASNKSLADAAVKEFNDTFNGIYIQDLEYIQKNVENKPDYFNKYITNEKVVVKTAAGLQAGDEYLGHGYGYVLFFVNDVLYHQEYIELYTAWFMEIPVEYKSNYYNYFESLSIEELNKMFPAIAKAEILSIQSLESTSDKYTSNALTDANNMYNLNITILDGTQTGSQTERQTVIPLYLEVEKQENKVDKEKQENEEDQEEAVEIVPGITFLGGIGAKISATILDVAGEVYKTMESALHAMGYEEIFSAFEFTLDEGDISDGITITFDVGTENNGREAIVLHQLQSGEFEEFKSIVSEGIVTAKVTELSPFVVALGEVVEGDIVDELDDEPQTGEGSFGFLFYATCFVLGVVLLKKRNEA